MPEFPIRRQCVECGRWTDKPSETREGPRCAGCAGAPIKLLSDLSPAVTAWVQDCGFKVYCEVPWNGQVIDIVGRKGRHGSEIVTVELCRAINLRTIRLASRELAATADVWIVSARRLIGRLTVEALAAGLGLAWVDRDFKVIEAYPPHKGHQAERQRLPIDLKGCRPGGVAGIHARFRPSKSRPRAG